jgi:hypothetical protein
MARSKTSTTEEPVGWRPAGNASLGDRIAAFTMLDGMADASIPQKCLRLALIGFTNAEIAEMLQTTPGAVRTYLSLERKKPRAVAKAGKL